MNDEPNFGLSVMGQIGRNVADVALMWEHLLGFAHGDWGSQPAAIQRSALDAARLGGYDVVLLDTAGRTTLDEQMTWTTLRTSAWRFDLEAALRRRRRTRCGS